MIAKHKPVVTIMPTILIVEKNGNIKPVTVKNAVEADFYKKAGFKSAEGFNKHTTWKLDINGTQYHIALYGKTAGKANMENKFEFPPPVDTVLFFGNCILANVVNGVVSELDAEDWEMIYQYLYGGFEDVSGSDDDEDDEDEADINTGLDGLEKTKDGYAKDGFIVDDEEEEEFDSEDELSSVESAPKPRGRVKAKPAAARKPEPVNEAVDAVLDGTSDLSEDSYD